MTLIPLLALLLLTTSFAASDDDVEYIIGNYENETRNLLPDPEDSYKNLESVMTRSEAFVEAASALGHLFANGSLGSCTTIDDTSSILSGLKVLHNETTQCFLHAVGPNATETVNRLQNVFNDTAAELFGPVNTTHAEHDDGVKEILEQIKNQIIAATDYTALPERMRLSLEEIAAEDNTTRTETPIPAWSLCESSLSNESRWNVLSILYELVGPGCENVDFEQIPKNISDISYVEASMRDFRGTESNRCLPTYFLRATHYDIELYNSFGNNIAKFLREQLFVYGFCYPVLKDSASKTVVDKEWALQKVKEIAKKLVDELDEIIPEKVDDAFGHAAPKEKFPYPNPDKDQYAVIARGLKEQIMKAWSLRNQFETIVYWPATGFSEHCVLNDTGSVLFAFHAENEKNLNYLVSWHARQDEARIRALNATFDGIDQNRVKELFRKTKKSNLCDRVEFGVNNQMGMNLISEDTFHTLVAVKCARKFVWYQLSYQYYQAAFSTSPYVIKFDGGNYDEACAYIALFP